MRLLRLLLGLHVHDGFWPQRGWQRCPCGMKRRYVLGREKQGKWQWDTDEKKQQQVFVLEKEER